MKKRFEFYFENDCGQNYSQILEFITKKPLYMTDSNIERIVRTYELEQDGYKLDHVSDDNFDDVPSEYVKQIDLYNEQSKTYYYNVMIDRPFTEDELRQEYEECKIECPEMLAEDDIKDFDDYLEYYTSMGSQGFEISHQEYLREKYIIELEEENESLREQINKLEMGVGK